MIPAISDTLHIPSAASRCEFRRNAGLDDQIEKIAAVGGERSGRESLTSFGYLL